MRSLCAKEGERGQTFLPQVGYFRTKLDFLRGESPNEPNEGPLIPFVRDVDCGFFEGAAIPAPFPFFPLNRRNKTRTE